MYTYISYGDLDGTIYENLDETIYGINGYPITVEASNIRFGNNFMPQNFPLNGYIENDLYCDIPINNKYLKCPYETELECNNFMCISHPKI
jgi:hypothetical protein